MKRSTILINGFIWRAVTILARKISDGFLKPIIKLGIILMLLSNFTLVFGACNSNEKAVLEAYDLRVNGKVDEAENLLETILKEDSTNAMAHFELARILNYKNMMGSKEADKHLARALKYDPDNVIYAYYNAKNCFLKAYISVHQGGNNTKELVNNSCKEFIRVLELKADYHEALMYLVEFYGMLPEEMGGDKTKAENYVNDLESMDRFYGAKARLVMLPQGTNIINYWEKYIEENGENCEALKELGVAFLFSENIDGASECFEKIMDLDKIQNVRLLDLARYHMIKVMQNRDAASEELPKARNYIQKYLDTDPQPIVPLKAYALGMLVKVEMFSGNKEEGQKLMQEAKSLDPYFSRATGMPSLALFEPPNKIDHHFQSFFIPY